MSTKTPVLDLTKPDYRDTRWDIQNNTNFDLLDEAHGFVMPSDIQELLGLDTAPVSVFIYNTAKDTDGGDWRNSCQDLSWYTEELNTATRGKTHEFPAVALIVAETNKVTIFDATDTTLPMWRVFGISATSSVFGVFRSLNAYQLQSVQMLSGVLTAGLYYTASPDSDNAGVHGFNFIDDVAFKYASNALYCGEVQGLINYIDTDIVVDSTKYPAIVHNAAHDVAMTILSGRTTPTIAVATDGGVSVIDGPAGVGTVVDITSATVPKVYSIRFNSDQRLESVYGSTSATFYASINDLLLVDDNNPSSLLGSGDRYVGDALIPALNGKPTVNTNDGVFGGQEGLTLLKENPMSPAEGMVNYITSDYQSGWQVGDSLMATLADAETGTVGTDITTEHVTNGTFDTDISGWIDRSAGTGSIAWNASQSMDLISVDSSNRAQAGTSFVTVVDQVYSLNLDVTATTVTQIGSAVGTADLFGGVSVVGTNTFTFKATSTETFIQLFGPNSSGTSNIDNVSVKAVQNLVENGEFSSDRSWVTTGGWAISGDVANGGGVSGAISQNTGINLVRKVKVSFEVSNYVSGNVTPQVAAISGTTVTDNGTYSEVIDASSATILLTTVSFSGSFFNGSIDNVSVELLDVPDRSVKNNPLQVVGELTKTPVATGSEPVAWSGFSATDYIEQPHNSDLDFGTGDFCVMGWASNTDSGVNYMYFRRDAAFSGLGLYAYFNNYVMNVNVSNTTLTGTIDTSDGKPHFIVTTRVSGVVSNYVDAVLDVTGVAAGTLTNLTATLTVGVRSDGNSPLDEGSIALLRFSSTVPSADQIKHIYDTEKHLFEDGAKCTLSGTSDSVTALDYDAATDTLYAGTSEGATEIVGVVTNNCEAVEQGVAVDTISVDGGIVLSNDVVTYPKVSLREVANSAAQAFAVITTKRDLIDNEFGAVEDGDYAEFEDDGTLVLHGGASTWDDINIDPTYMTGKGNSPVRVTIPGTTLSAAGFSGSQTDEVEGIYEYPHKCKLHLEDGATAVTLDFHCHVMPLTTDGGNVRIGIEYGFSDETTPLTSSTTIEVTAALGTTIGLKQTIDISDTVQAPVELGTQIHMRFYRLGGDALDTSSEIVIVQTIGCHVESNMLGSREETTK